MAFRRSSPPSLPVRRLLLAGAGALLLLPAALADDRTGEREHDRVRRDVEKGQVKPLAELRHIVLARVAGTIIDTRIDRDGRVTVYEFRVLRSDGHVVEVEVDAATGLILEVEND